MGGWLADCVMYVGMSGDKGHGTRNLGQGVGAGSRGGGAGTRDQGDWQAVLPEDIGRVYVRPL